MQGKGTILDEINGKPKLPPPISKMEKWYVFALRAASSLIWWGGGGGVGMGVIMFKIVALLLFKLVKRNAP